jgi:hypothetical protein
MSENNKDARRWLLRGAVEELGDLLASLGVSISEAAWRGHDAAVLVHVKQARLTLVEAIAVAKQLTLSDEGAGQ